MNTATHEAVVWWREKLREAEVTGRPVWLMAWQDLELERLRFKRPVNTGGRPRKLTDEQARDAAERIAGGESRASVAASYGVQERTIGMYLKRLEAKEGEA